MLTYRFDVVTIAAPGGLEQILAVTYGPLVALLVHDLAGSPAQS